MVAVIAELRQRGHECLAPAVSERFQIMISRMGRTDAWARIRNGASAPAPTISSRALSGRDRLRLCQSRCCSRAPRGQSGRVHH